MNTEAFIRWALDDARTVEERYTVELLVEQGVNWWNSRRNIYNRGSLEERMEKQRQRALNPAYEPDYSEKAVRQAAEMFPEFKNWWHCRGHDERPIRDLKAFAFFTELEELKINNTEVTDLSPLAGMSRLRFVQFGSSKCEDYRPLSRCASLRQLELTLHQHWWTLTTHWPDVSGLEKLAQLETLLLQGNLLAFARGIAWPNVKTATLKCEPLAARSLRELPQLPACEFLTLAGVEILDGIEAFPHLRNLKIETDVRNFEPLVALKNLTCFTCGGFEPLDIAPLARLPKLQCATFDTRYKSRLNAIAPRDFSPFTDAPMLRELHVEGEGTAPVESEVKTLKSFLLPWDDVFLAAQPRPLPPKLRMIVAPWNKSPFNREMQVQLDADDGGLPDTGLRECESRWVGNFVGKNVSAKLGATDWGNAKGDGLYRRIIVNVESFAIVERLPEIVEAIRESICQLRGNYHCMLMIALTSPPPEPTPAQKELEAQFSREQDEADYERRRREQQEYVERLHRFHLKKQLGETINPEEFVPPPREALPPPPWEREDEDGDENQFGDVIVKEKPDPPPSMFDDEHPLADKYRLIAHFDLDDIWFPTHSRDIAIYLMHRQPDEEIPEEKKAE